MAGSVNLGRGVLIDSSSIPFESLIIRTPETGITLNFIFPEGAEGLEYRKGMNLVDVYIRMGDGEVISFERGIVSDVTNDLCVQPDMSIELFDNGGEYFRATDANIRRLNDRTQVPAEDPSE